MAKRKKKKKLKTFLMPKLRSASLYWDRRQDVYDRIKVDRGQYACEMCGEICSRKEIDIDHITPIIALDGSMDWENAEQVGLLIFAMFCESEGLQGLCKPCHKIKTMQEDEMRRMYKEKKKSESKNTK